MWTADELLPTEGYRLEGASATLGKSTMQSLSATVRNPTGLHARPAAAFVEAANRFQCSLRIRNLSAASPWADAKSILAVLALGVEHGHEVELAADGPDESRALTKLVDLLSAPPAEPD